MAAPITYNEEDRYYRRAEMVKLRKIGWNYSKIGKKFGISKNSARVIILRATNNEDVKYDETNPSPYQRARNRECRA